MNPDVIVQHALLCAILIDASLAWAVLLRNPKNASNQSYFFLICAITLWQVATFVSLFFFHADAERIFSFRLMYAAVIAALFCILYFVNTFGAEQHHRQWLGIMVAALCVESVLVVATPLIFVRSEGVLIQTGHGYPYVVFFVCALIAGLFASIIHRLIMVDDVRQRTQLEYMMIGLFIPMLFGVFSTVIVPFLETTHDVIQMSRIQVFGAATTVFFSFVMAYAMARHRLMDVRIVFKRKSVALMLTLLAIVLIIGVAFLALRENIHLNVWTVIGMLALFGVATVLMYEVLLKIVTMFMKRGVVDVAAYTQDEERFMRKIESPRTWARRWAAKVQKQFAVDSLECITYDHRAQCWRQVFPESKVKYALDDAWVKSAQSKEIVVCALDCDSDEAAPIVRAMKGMKREVCVAMHDSFRCMGVWMLGQKLDGSAWTARDLRELKKFAHDAEQELWYVMQQEYTLIMAMENGAELPQELLRDDDEDKKYL